jgi:hypothetical protein
MRCSGRGASDRRPAWHSPTRCSCPSGRSTSGQSYEFGSPW